MISLLNFIAVREQLKELTKQYDKSENDLKALQSVGQVRYIITCVTRVGQVRFCNPESNTSRSCKFMDMGPVCRVQCMEFSCQLLLVPIYTAW